MMLIGAIGVFISQSLQLPRLGLIAFVFAALCFAKSVSYPYMASLKTLPAKIIGLDAEAPTKIMSLNTHLGSRSKTHLNQLIQALVHHQADIILLQELNIDHWTKLSTAPEIKAHWPYQHYCAPLLCRVALLSKQPLLNIQTYHLRKTNLPILTANVTLHGRFIKIANIHSARPHLWYATQNKQFEELGIWANKQTDALFIGGDFNTTAFSKPMARLLAQTQLIPVGRAQPTWPSFVPSVFSFLRLGLDQALVSKGDFYFLSKTIGASVGSDHLPVILTMVPKRLAKK